MPGTVEIQEKTVCETPASLEGNDGQLLVDGTQIVRLLSLGIRIEPFCRSWITSTLVAGGKADA